MRRYTGLTNTCKGKVIETKRYRGLPNTCTGKIKRHDEIYRDH